MLAYLISAAALAAASAAGYQSMAPSGQWYGRTFRKIPGPSKKLALTYDDGPNDPYTPQLLEVLARHGVRATFFMIGRYVQQKPQIARELVQAGHVAANHTYTHPQLIFQSPLQARAQISSCRKILEDAVGQPSNLFRPPFGGRRPTVMRLIREEGLIPVMWSVTGYDWKPTTADRIERHVQRQLCGGDVILMHDGGHTAMGVDRSHTVQATDRVITKYKNEGYEFVTVPELMAAAAST
ncbi:MAG TPA: polysaccharide deacetylase family protein [Terriglobales bacterium]|jgi:peptidoglycan/xylan/chitin deacetylase (PgdA/CDA1 family)